jgi:predicted amidohydrolase
VRVRPPLPNCDDNYNLDWPRVHCHEGLHVGDPGSQVRAPLTIAVAQPVIVPCDLTANAQTHAQVVRSARARVVVFPELSLTGYEPDAPAVGTDDPRLAPLVDACAETGSLALVGAPVSEDGRSHIAMLAIDGDGARVVYRKMWLGGAEPDRFTAGPAPVVLDVEGWRIGLAICKDTGVPQHAADTASLGMDVYVAGLVESAADAVVPEQRALRVAADHGVWVAFASCAGPTGGGYDRTAGRSGIWSPSGVAVAHAGPEPGAVARARLQPNAAG